MKITSGFSLLLLSASLIFTSCSAHKPNTQKMETTSVKLTNVHWKLIEISGLKAPDKVASEPFIFFSDSNRVNGNTGCNTFFGGFEAKNNQLHFSGLASTLMACMDSFKLEQKFNALLRQNPVYRIQGDTLAFIDNNKKVVAKFLRIKNADLLGKWELTKLYVPEMDENKIFPMHKPFMRFDLGKGMVNGNGGCNNFNGQVSINGNQIKFGMMMQTKMFCKGGGENLFMNRLKEINRYNVSPDGKTLSFFKGDLKVLELTHTEN